jgi:GAF domain-containing protein
VASAATSVLGAALTRIWIEGPDPGLLRQAFVWGHARDAGTSVDVVSIPAGGGLVGRVFASRVPEYRLDIQEDGEWLNRRFVRDAGLHAYAGLPLVAQGRVWGAMSLLFTERREFTPEEKELMMLLADSVAIALERSRAAGASFPAA